MKKLIIRLLVLVAIVVVIDRVAGFVLSYIAKNTQEREMLEYKHTCDHVTDDILLMGSSRCKTHYDPKIFEDSLGFSCFNCGVMGEGIITHYGLYQLIRKRYTPKIILFDVYALFDLQEETRSQFDVLKLYSDRKEVADIIKEVDPLEPNKLQSQMYRYNYQWIKLLAKFFQKYDLRDKGYSPYIGDLDPNKLPTSKAESPIVYDSLKIDYFRRFVRECKESGTQLYFCLSPYYLDVDETIYAPIFELAEKEGIPVINHLNDSFYKGRTDLFHDERHLNDKGAHVYSAQMAHIIKTQLQTQGLPTANHQQHN